MQFVFLPCFLLLFYRFFFLVPRRGGNCSRVVEPKYCSTDLHYSQTFVPEKHQSSVTVLQSIKDSKCSPVFEKYLCYTTVPPCKPNDLSVYVPCRSVCEQVGLYFMYFVKRIAIKTVATPLKVQRFCRVINCFIMSSRTQRSC